MAIQNYEYTLGHQLFTEGGSHDFNEYAGHPREDHAGFISAAASQITHFEELLIKQLLLYVSKEIDHKFWYDEFEGEKECT
ncbi:hypothetical protein [Lentibacillus halodurans]|uniref:hypothetical protein n=1 Tax=Lentibacillus halodurans TaxID=237679 RepID=UPI00148059CE|nr:hypothetical protein [Lentibacillus halodurans]